MSIEAFKPMPMRRLISEWVWSERVEWGEKGKKERIGKVDSLVRARERERERGYI